MKRHALFVGVNNYVDPVIQKLAFSSEDATELAVVFRQLLKFDRVEKLINPKHSPDVVDAVKDMTRGLGAGDLFLFFFAGHGFRVKENHVLVCAQDEFVDLEDEYAGLSVGQLKKRMRGPWNRMLVLDACQNDIRATRGADCGVATRDLELIHALDDGAPGAGFQIVITSCSEGQKALEVSDLKHGLFTSAFLNSVTSFANSRRRIDLEGLRADLGVRMGDLIARYRLGDRQEPMFTMPMDAGGVILLDGVAPESAVQAALPMSALPHAAAPASAGECAEEVVAFVEKSKKLRGVMQFDAGYISKYFITDPKPMECVMENPFILIFEGAISDMQAMLSFMTVVEKTGRPLLIIAEDVGDEVLKMLVEKKLRGACCVCAVKAPGDCRTELLEDVAVVTGGLFISKDLNIQLQDILVERLGRAKKVVVSKDGTIVIGGRGTPENIKERVEMIKWQIDEAVSGDDRDRLRERISKFSCEEYGAAQRLYIQAEKYYRGQNFAKAFEFYQKAAKKGEAEATYSLGRMFEKGEHVAKNSEKAMFWYRRAAELGSERAVRLVMAGVEEKIKDLKAKALQGDADAQYALGEKFYNAGDDIEQNYVEALKWYRMAAENGHADALYSIGVMYDCGEGVERDGEEALTWYLRAAVQGQEDAHEALRENLQELFESEDDAETAEEWCEKVLKEGDEKEIEIVKEIKEEIEEEQKRDQQSEDAATEWVPRDEEKRKSWDFIREAAAGIEGSNAFPHVLLGDDCLVDYAISSDTAALLLEVLPYSCDYGVVDEDASPASDEVSLAFVAKLMKAKASLNKQSDAYVSIGVFASQATIQDIRSMVADSKFKDVHLEYLTCANFTDRVRRLLSCQQSDVQDEQQEDDVDSLNEQAANYYHGLNGVKEDRARAVELYKRAAALGDMTAQTILGVCYYNGDGVAQDYAEAVKWLRKAAEDGGVTAQAFLGTCYKQGNGVPQDNAESARFFEMAAEKGHAQAQRCLGWAYYGGEGVAQDYAKAVKWFRKAAEQGDANAQCLLAGCYMTGKGVGKNYSEALDWFRKAAEQGDADAGNILAVLKNLMANEDQQEAEESETQDGSQRMYEQAENYYRGRNGVKEDRAKAFELYQKAAEQGHAEAQYSLGYMYAYGEGTAKDEEKALFWYRKAAAQGHQKAARFIEGLKERIKKEEDAERSRLYWERQERERKERERREHDDKSRKAQARQEAAAREQRDTEEKMEQALRSYEKGNYSVAALLWRICAVRGVAAAQHNLGALYATGKGVEQDYAQAVEWLQKGAAQGDENSQQLLNTIKTRLEQEKQRLLSEKQSLERQTASEREKNRQLRQEQGKLLNTLGVRFYTGTQGQVQDYVKAVEHFRKAAEMGNVSAQFNLGVCYASGTGVAKNTSEAIRWYRRAAENGHDKAKEELRKLGYAVR